MGSATACHHNTIHWYRRHRDSQTDSRSVCVVLPVDVSGRSLIPGPTIIPFVQLPDAGWLMPKLSMCIIIEPLAYDSNVRGMLV